MKPLLYSVLPRPPHPTRDGLAIRNYHLLAGLAQTFRVRAAALLPPHLEGSGEYPPGIEVESVPQAGRALRRAASLAECLLAGKAYPAVLYRSRRLSALLEGWVAREMPEWVVAHSYHVGDAAVSSGARSWVDFHNVDSEIWRRMGKSAASPVRRTLARWQAPRVERMEREILRRASGTSCVSERDARVLAGFGGAAPLVVANGVDLVRYAFRPEPAREEVVFFVGDLSWPPNAEGIRWFCARVWPALRRLRPSARLEVLGRGDVPLEATAAGDGDLVPRRRRRHAPSLESGGRRGRAAPCRRRDAAEDPGGGRVRRPGRLDSDRRRGTGSRPGSEILLAQAAEEFADAVARLLADPGARRAQAAAARRRVERIADWRQIGAPFRLRAAPEASRK